MSVTITCSSLRCDSVHSVVQAFDWMFILVPNWWQCFPVFSTSIPMHSFLCCFLTWWLPRNSTVQYSSERLNFSIWCLFLYLKYKDFLIEGGARLISYLQSLQGSQPEERAILQPQDLVVTQNPTRSQEIIWLIEHDNSTDLKHIIIVSDCSVKY